MTCNRARQLFGAFWDDEITQAERESLEGHFATCTACREEYDTYSRALELMNSLPRIEAAPDLVERVVARARRAEKAPDRVGAAGPRWIPATAAAALALVAAGVAAPWLMPRLVPTAARTGGAPVMEPALRTPVAGVSAPVAPGGSTAREAVPGRAAPAGEPLAAISDSLFNHSEDVEFILDAMTLRRGRPSAVRARPPAQPQQATITF